MIEEDICLEPLPSTYLCVYITYINTKHEWVYIGTNLLVHINTHTSGIYSTKTKSICLAMNMPVIAIPTSNHLNIVAYAKLYKQIIFILSTFA